MLGHVGQGLADYEVSSHLGPFGQPGLHPYVEFHRHRGPAGQRLQREAEPAQRQDGGMDAAGDLPQFLQYLGGAAGQAAQFLSQPGLSRRHGFLRGAQAEPE